MVGWLGIVAEKVSMQDIFLGLLFRFHGSWMITSSSLYLSKKVIVSAPKTKNALNKGEQTPATSNASP